METFTITRHTMQQVNSERFNFVNASGINRVKWSAINVNVITGILLLLLAVSLAKLPKIGDVEFLLYLA